MIIFILFELGSVWKDYYVLLKLW